MTLKEQRQTRYLITGGAGFVGSHLSRLLLERNHYVTVIDDLSTGLFSNIEDLTGHPRFSFAISSITHENVLDRLASQNQVIIHLAAAVGVKLIVEEPVRTIETNIMGTEHVLQAAVRYRSKVLIASTSEVYGKSEAIPFREDSDSLLGPTCRNRWAYAASKMVDEFLALAYHHEKGLPVTIFRLFNTVGPGQLSRYGMVIPRFAKQALRGEPLTVYGDGQQCRCFLHVRDAVEAISLLAESEQAVGQVFNIGSTEEISILELARLILSRSSREKRGPAADGENIRFIPFDEVYSPDFEDMDRRVPDTGKIERLVGWRPTRNLEAIIDDVVASLDSRPVSGLKS